MSEWKQCVLMYAELCDKRKTAASLPSSLFKYMSAEADPFLLQKLEFLELELQESKEREMKLKKTYDSLLSLVNAPTFGSPGAEEVEKVKSAYEKELESMRQRAKQERERLEEELRTVRTRCRDAELELKQAAERERAGQRHSLAAESAEETRERADLERRLQSLKTQFEQYRDNASREKERLLREWEAKAKDAASAHCKEKAELMTLISHAETKTTEQRDKLASLKTECDSMKADMRTLRQENDELKQGRPVRRYKDAVEEEKQRLLCQVHSLQGKIQSYAVRSASKEGRKLTSRDTASARPVSELAVLRAQVTKAEKTIEALKTELAEEKKKALQLSPRSDDTRPTCQSTVRQSRGEDSMVDKLKGQLLENSHALETAKDHLRDSKVETAQLQLQKERLQVDLEKMNIETKQMKLDWSVERERLLEEVRKLKNEVKFLIGKLVKAKGKLAVEGELTETTGKEETTRSKSVNKSRLRLASPQRHCVSPLNLSVITRAESPCWNQSMDVI